MKSDFNWPAVLEKIFENGGRMDNILTTEHAYIVTQVVNMGTSSKMCQRNFVPTPHPGTLEIFPTLRNEYTKVGVSAFYE